MKFFSCLGYILIFILIIILLCIIFFAASPLGRAIWESIEQIFIDTNLSNNIIAAFNHTIIK